jgi:hypothetical protein
MRRLVALVLIAAFVSVSSLPLLPAEAACIYAAKRMTADTGGHQHSAVAHKHKNKKSGNALSGEAQHCRVECSCGCHRDLDQLPHQFSPHVAALCCQPQSNFTDRERAEAPDGLDALPARVADPPPRFVS